MMLNARAQGGLCPSNLDFETGDFSGWLCRAGVTANNPLPITGPIPGRHTIISAATAGLDPFGFFPEISPLGSAYSVKLGNHQTQAQAESISYTYAIPSTLSVFSMMIYYAVVIESPGHTPANQPRFQARIIDVTTGVPIPCVDFDFIAQTTPGGFQTSPIPGNLGSPVLYKDWTPISINLNAYIGRTIMLEFVTKDCSQNGHAGYAYIDVGTSCNGAITGNYVCPNDPGITLTAPFGFQGYTWYSDATFSTILSNSQTLPLFPPPPFGTVFPVIVDPFPGFGCRDTLYATVDVGIPPNSVAGPDRNICINEQVQIGTASTPGYTYSWTPVSYVSNPLIANPLAWNPVAGVPEEFIVTTTDILNGCISSDTMYITSGEADTSLTITGKNVYCAGDPAAGSLSVSNTLTGIQWYDGTTAIPGATGTTYQPITSGNYWAQVQAPFCVDSTRTVSFTINPLPVSDAGPDMVICINETVQVGAASNPLYTYSWTPASQVDNPASSNPNAWVNGTVPETFIVQTTDQLTGCFSYDTTIITGRAMDTTLSITGNNEFCEGSPAAGVLTVNSSLPVVQWYDGTNPVPGATSSSYQPLVSGSYWAQLQNAGCTDSTRTVAFTVHALPVADFTMNNDSACITNNSFTFTNASSVSDGANLSYIWRFSDGSTLTSTDPVKTFNVPGNFTVRLVTSTSFGCKDSTTNQMITVLPNGKPDFTWDSICVNRPVQFTNTSNEFGSASVDYTWRFNNGSPDQLVRNPFPVTFTTEGTADVLLRLVAFGCENYPDSIVKRVQVNKPQDGITYRTITVPEGSSQFIHARPGIGSIYNWQPPMQLSSYTTQYTEFTAINDVLYTITITDPHTCITRDTLQMLVLKKPGFYLPTAFTPNNDGLNDLARPYLIGMNGLKSFSVFNRTGQLIYYTQTYGQGWDGKYRGVDQPSGVFVWVLEFFDSSNKLVLEKGTITLIR